MQWYPEWLRRCSFYLIALYFGAWLDSSVRYPAVDSGPSPFGAVVSSSESKNNIKMLMGKDKAEFTQEVPRCHSQMTFPRLPSHFAPLSIMSATLELISRRGPV